MADEAFVRQLLRRMGRLGIRYVRPKIRSSKGKPIRTLQRALQSILLSDDTLVLRVPHYWAVYVHDGRRAPFGPRRSTFLIWFRNPREDPRLKAYGGHTPQRSFQLRSLSPSQFEDVLEQDAEARRAGRLSPVVITTEVRTPTRGTRFFDNEPGGGMAGFSNQVGREAMSEFRFFLTRFLRTELGLSGRVPLATGGMPLSFRRIEEVADVSL